MGDREENSIIEALNFSYNHDMDDAQLPLGLTFHPTDEELITHYLIRKVLDSNFTGRAIAEVDLNKCEPQGGFNSLLYYSLCILNVTKISLD